MAKVPGRKGTFIVQVMDSQNATWQGTVTWANGNRTRAFRSALELIKLIDSTLEERPAETEVEAG